MNEALGDPIVAMIESGDGSTSSIEAAIHRGGFRCERFASSKSFLEALSGWSRDLPLCVVCDLAAPSQGRELLARLRSLHPIAHMVFYARQPGMRDVVTAMQAGAVSVVDLTDELDYLSETIGQGLLRSEQLAERERERRQILEELDRLNEGEREVLRGIMRGQLNKEIAHHLNLSIRTIEQRRRQIFRKLRVQHPASLAQKVLLATQDGQMSAHGLPSFSDVVDRTSPVDDGQGTTWRVDPSQES